MLWIAFSVLVALWLVCMATAFMLGGFVHLLLVIALSLLLVQFMNKQRMV